MSVDWLDGRINAIFQMLFAPNEGERRNALESLYALIHRQGIPPTSISLVLRPRGDRWDLLSEIKSQLDSTKAELRYYKSHLPPNVVRRFDRRWKVVDRWPELEELLHAKFHGRKGLPDGWFSWLCAATGAKPKDVRRWRRGLDTIPDDIFVRLNALPDRNNARRRWTEGEAHQLASLVRSRKPRGAMAYLLGRTPAQIAAQLSRPLPYEAGVGVGAHPMSVEELWRIGITLFGPGWRREMPMWFGRPNMDLFGHGLTASQRKQLRDAYHTRKGGEAITSVIQLGPPANSLTQSG